MAEGVVRGVVAVILCLALALPGPVFAEQDTAGEEETAGDQQLAIATDQTAVTEHTLDLGGKLLEYTVTAGALPIRKEAGKPEGQMFYIGYEKAKTEKANRPVAFIFNGGPGAASAYLHLGALGPKRLATRHAGVVQPPPRLESNPDTWLWFTDLVFIDPIGTGYSRTTGKERSQEEGDDFWGTRQDLESLAEFIRLYLTRNERWLSPKFLVGESYGGFRGAALSQMLASEFGIGLNGLVLISPVLEFSLIFGDDYLLLPWALRLPAYAATAAYHGKIDLESPDSSGPRAALRAVERFSLGNYLTLLVQGDQLDSQQRVAFFEQLQQYTGLPVELLQQFGARIDRERFAKYLLRDQQRIVGLYDGSVSGVDPFPQSPLLRGDDPTLEGLTAPFTGAFNSYVREELGFETDLEFVLLNREISRKWQWKSGFRGVQQGFVGTADSLREAMSLNNKLRVLIVHGVYDLVTPYFSSLYVVHQIALDNSLRDNLVLKVYRGGHMMYLNSQARAELASDAWEFFSGAVSE